MPDALELPRVLRAVVPLVRGEGLARFRGRVVHELVALALRHLAGLHGHSAAGRLPRLAAVAGALDDLSEPPARLRRIQPVRIGGGAFHVIDLPAGEVWTADVPPARFPSAVNTNAPLRVPTSTRTPLMPFSFLRFAGFPALPPPPCPLAGTVPARDRAPSGRTRPRR